MFGEAGDGAILDVRLHAFFELLPNSLVPEGGRGDLTQRAELSQGFCGSGCHCGLSLFFIRAFVPQLWRAYQNRYIDPKTAHRKCSLDKQIGLKNEPQSSQFFSFELGQEPKPDKFSLRNWFSKLDPQDRQWAMKQTDIEICASVLLRKARSATTTRENARAQRTK